jgi:ADP-heptose:LPS heptosyltransferase
MPDPAIILCRPDRVGDVIIATACLPAIQRQLPGVRVVFVAREVMRPLLEGHPLLHRFIGLPTGVPSMALRTLAEAFGEQRASNIVHLHPDKLCQRAGRLARIPRRIGYRSSWLLDRTLTQAHGDPRQRGCRHEAEYNFDLLADLGIQPPPPDELRPCVHLAMASQVTLSAKLAAAGCGEPGRYVVLNPTAHSVRHRWPPENFAWLARELRPHCDRVILIGEPAGDASVQTVASLLSDLNGGVVNLAGELDLGALGWLLRNAALLVSRNTGSTHLAAAVGCPVVELFGRLEGPYGPVRWRSLGEKVRAVNAPAGQRHLLESKRSFWERSHAAIPRAAVLSAALESLRLKT